MFTVVLYPVSYILYPISYILYPISYILYTGRNPILVNIFCPLKNSGKQKTLQEQDLKTPVKAWKTSQDLLPI